MAPRQVTISVLHRAISKHWAPFSATRISDVQSRLISQKGGQLRSYTTSSFLRLVNRSRARPAARPCTRSCGFESSGAIPFPGADSIFSDLCGAISGRHFRATPFCRQVLSRRDPDDRNASVQKIDDRLGGLLRDGGTRTNIERPRDFGKKFVERLGSCNFSSEKGRLAAWSKNWTIHFSSKRNFTW
jgi:hypothetical protein